MQLEKFLVIGGRGLMKNDLEFLKIFLIGIFLMLVITSSVFCSTITGPIEIASKQDVVYEKHDFTDSAFKLLNINNDIYLFYVVYIQIPGLARYGYFYKKVIESSEIINGDLKEYLYVGGGTTRAKENKYDICYIRENNRLIQVRESQKGLLDLRWKRMCSVLITVI
jgi:hypothetical protein